MPLDKSGSKKSVGKNIEAEISAGKPKRQAIAIALDVKRRAKMADGGNVRLPGASYNTKLNPLDEMAYRQWVQDNHVPTNPDATTPQDYDMRGFYQGLQQQNPRAQSAVDPNDNQLHYPDYWKTPLHNTFSNESQWAAPNSPSWTDDDKLVSPNGRVLFDDRNHPSEAQQLLATPRADGGKVPIPGVPSNTPNATNFAGYIHGTSGGRTDNKPMKVAPGSYVIPSDILSGLGQGNSHAGAAALQRMFKMGPHAKTLGESGKFADGGMPGEGVPIVAASGEMVVDPETVARIGKGDMDVGHKTLDAMVAHVRKSTIKKLRKLPPPKRS